MHSCVYVPLLVACKKTLLVEGLVNMYIETKIAMGSSCVANGKVMHHCGKVTRGQMQSHVVTCASHLENLEAS